MEFGGWVCGAWLFGLASVFALAIRVLGFVCWLWFGLCGGFGFGILGLSLFCVAEFDGFWLGFAFVWLALWLHGWR